jgi:large subunit ribosomal protein L21
MYAVIKTGGKQHKVKPGDVLEVELIHSDDDTVTFTPLLVVDDDGGTHFGKEASRAKVTAKLVGEQKGDKVKVFKYRQKTGYSKRAGHRQMYTLIEIQDVSLPGSGSKAPAKKAQSTKAEPKDGGEEGTPRKAASRTGSKDAESKSAATDDSAPKPTATDETEADRTDANAAAEAPDAEDIGAVMEAEPSEAADVSADRVEDAAEAGGPEA